MAETDTIADELVKIYTDKILPAGITGPNKAEEIIDIVSNYPWTAQQFAQRNTESNKITYTHNIPFCYAIERQQTIGSGAANLINSIIGSGGALLDVSAQTLKNGLGLLGRTSEGTGNLIQPTSGNNGNATEGNAQKPATNDTKGEAPAQQANSGEASALAWAMSTGKSLLDCVGGWMDGAVEGLDWVKGQVSSVGNKLSNTVTPRLEEGNLANSKFLHPWKWLYLTKPTTKRYVFPTFTSNDLLKYSSSWGSTQESLGGFKELIEPIEKKAEQIRAIKELTDFLPDEKRSISYELYNVEKALGYNYQAGNGPAIQSQFILFNTVKKDAWKKNYRFLLMFLLRNMPLRTSSFTYKAPLLYDIIVPGIKHLPLCYVSEMSIQAEGHVRNMVTDNILKEIISDTQSATTLVPVPEAWRIQITFKCLIPDTMNLILNTTTFPINVTTVSR